MFDVSGIIAAGGLALIALIIFAEVGLMVGFFLPGDTLLLSAGIFAAQGKLPIEWTIPLVALAAILGDNTSYFIGHKLGPRLFRKKDGLIFRQEYVEKAEKFYEIYGNKTALLAHWLPVIRTFAPLLAGVGKMRYRTFAIYDAIGDIGWAAAVTLLGYFIGTRIPNIDHYIMLAVAAAVVISFGPTVYHLIKAVRERRRTPESE
ncbi:MAG TPA: VTT domain-containing protein [Candidatus Saccharimonadales bacterium]|jgi:membrane-associated protein|nr:VTT domain-containing protein [Candidatus Saccharimonadales bacterium]